MYYISMLHTSFESVILPVKRNLQDEKYDCGPASLKIILDTLGKEIDEEKLMEMGKTTPEDGTTPKALITTLNKLKVAHTVFERSSVTIVESAITNLNLCLIDYQSWGDNGKEYEKLETGHYSVIFGFNKTHFYIADPAKRHTEKCDEWGFRTIRKDLFEKHWKDVESNGKKTFHWMMSVPLFQEFI